MNASVIAGSLLSGVLLVAPAVQAQQVSADVVFRGGPVAGHVAVGDGYSTYRREPVVAYRRPPVRRVVVVERHAPRVIVVERVHRHKSPRYWKRHGFRPVTLYYIDGRYYDRGYGRGRERHEVIVYERGGRYYADCDDDRDHRGGRHHEHRNIDWDD